MPPKTNLNVAAVEALMLPLGIDGYSDLARRSGIERSYLSRIMRGERPAKASVILAIATALKVPVVAIVGAVDEQAEVVS